jgi:hypothetical protein
MGNNIKIVVFLLVLFCIITTCKKEKGDNIIPDGCTIPLAKDAYNYPLKPGMAEWAKLNSGEEMRQALMMPETVLSTISTDGLIETCLNYPMFGDITAYNRMQSAYDSITGHFNGYQELYKRSNVGDKLVIQYGLMNATCLENNYPTCYEGWIEITFASIEMLLAQDTILKQLDNLQILELNKDALTKYRDKLTLPQKHFLFSRLMTALVIGRILKREKYIPFINKLKNDGRIDYFINTVDFNKLPLYPEILDTIVNYGNKISNLNK